MRECWLKPNRRALGVALTAPLAVAFGGAAALVAGWAYANWWALAAGGLLSALGVLGVAALLRLWPLPKIAYEDGRLLLYLGTPTPVAVPIDVVEVFFLGSGPALGDGETRDGPQTANVVIRISEAAKDWHNRDMPPTLGRWSDGYIVLRGTWCEPIGHERLNIINRRLAEVRRQRRSAAENSTQVTP